MALGRLRLDIGHGERRQLEVALEGFRLLALADVEALDLLAVGADEARVEDAAVLGRQRRHQRPVFLRHELLDLELAVADEPQRHRLHAAGRARARELAPQHRRQVEADEIIEGAARQIGVDQRAVDLARLPHGGLHRVLGDGVEGDALDRNALQGALLVERLDHVPGDGFALTVRVGGEDQLVGAFHGLGDLRHALGAAALDLPDHVEIGLGIDRAVLRRQVADMAEGGQDLVALAEIFVDRLGLRRRLDDDDLHEPKALIFLKETRDGRLAPEPRFASFKWCTGGAESNPVMVNRR